MASLSFTLAKAVQSGRGAASRARTREAVLVSLLRKRGAAHRAGMARQERLLRNQILWSLPVRRGESDG